MSAVTNRSNARSYVWGAACDGWHLHEGEDLSVIQERMPAGTAEVRHRHLRARQFFYVLTGEARMELDGAEHRLGPGDGLHVAPLLAHRIRNEGPQDLHFIVISAPRSHGDREELAL